MTAIRSNPGWINATTDGTWAEENALFLQIFSGEVMTAFDEVNVMRNLHFVRSISHGKSASFPCMWKADAAYHTPGNPVLGSNQIEHNERIIKIDDLLLADVFIYDLDELKNHYDIRSEYSKQLGAALSRAFDKKCLRVAVLAARAAGNTTSSPGGTVLKNTAAATDGEVLAGLMFSAAQAMDEKDVPEEGRNMITKPAQYYLMAQSTKLINQDWGGKGAYAEGKIVKVADINLIKSNNLPGAVVTAVDGENNTYSGDFSDTVASVFTRHAIGTVALKDITVQKTGNDFNVMYQGDLMVAKMAVGHDYLRPECAVEISKAA